MPAKCHSRNEEFVLTLFWLGVWKSNPLGRKLRAARASSIGHHQKAETDERWYSPPSFFVLSVQSPAHVMVALTFRESLSPSFETLGKLHPYKPKCAFLRYYLIKLSVKSSHDTWLWLLHWHLELNGFVKIRKVFSSGHRKKAMKTSPGIVTWDLHRHQPHYQQICLK